MPAKRYRAINFTPEKQLVIDNIVRLVAQYEADGELVTSRQLYYRFVSLKLFPAGRTWIRTPEGKWERSDAPDATTNAEPNYKWLCGIIADARLDGQIDWEMLEDRTRAPSIPKAWESPGEIIDAVADQFRIDKWANQPFRVEVWVEKDALEGVIERVAAGLNVTSFSCRGYASASALWAAGQRLKRYVEDYEQTPVILHLGDHDPSGIDMSRDIKERVMQFMDGCAGALQFERIALNRDQIRRYKPPPDPAKMADSRAEAYIETYGTKCWELDALEPSVLRALIEEKVLEYRNEKKYKAKIKEENAHRADLRRVANNWDAVVENFG